MISLAIVGQNDKKVKIHTIAFYNMENLFDTINDPYSFDESSPIMEVKTNKGKIYKEKIHNMAYVISQIGVGLNPNPPSIIGVSEVENKRVLEDLVNDSLLKPFKYGIIHFDSPDPRGIDVALLYRTTTFFPKELKTYEVQLMDETTGKRQYTRDELWVAGILDDEKIYINVNHWPSRRGGEEVSKNKRSVAAKLTKHVSDSLFSVDPYAKIVIMGDFNDNPTDYGLFNILGAKFDSKDLKLKSFYNVLGNQFLKGNGTHAYLDSWGMFDQLILSSSWLETNSITFKFYKAGIYNSSFLITKEGKYKGYPFRSFGDEGFTGGYSDHFPVFFYLIKEVQ